jgi:hypothetical protein
MVNEAFRRKGHKRSKTDISFMSGSSILQRTNIIFNKSEKPCQNCTTLTYDSTRENS